MIRQCPNPQTGNRGRGGRGGRGNGGRGGRGRDFGAGFGSGGNSVPVGGGGFG